VEQVAIYTTHPRTRTRFRFCALAQRAPPPSHLAFRLCLTSVFLTGCGLCSAEQRGVLAQGRRPHGGGQEGVHVWEAQRVSRCFLWFCFGSVFVREFALTRARKVSRQQRGARAAAGWFMGACTLGVAHQLIVMLLPPPPPPPPHGCVAVPSRVNSAAFQSVNCTPNDRYET
jgi:hypothetical protein